MTDMFAAVVIGLNFIGFLALGRGEAKAKALTEATANVSP